ncbi:sugar phosphate isomerase/epimerase family protein [Rubinisphaera sp. JC750]|uniref:sugar phosphate isomerase/epimerase family protein n=1 Tax=Rubinisphaera sp. JC750 TaxID=2898658 RepID=UPI001F3FD401|nr:sugar phosphate isomerase/epimerase family protein [Rubinisphaera sp. JC750]
MIEALSVGSAPDRQKLAVHTMTTKPWKLETAVREYAARDVQGISIWVEALEGYSNATVRRIVSDHGLKVPALVRGGFFCDESSSVRQQKIDRNRQLIETAAEIEADMLVLVVGAIPQVSLDVQRGWVSDGIAALLDLAASTGVKLAIEPLHPMYAGDKSCINRISEANAICDRLAHPLLGVAVDVYHVWWDPDLQEQIAQLGKQNRLFGFHLCDWRVPTRDLLTDRALMGEGCVDIRSIRASVEAAGFDGWNEVEIFSEDYWGSDQGDFLDRIVGSYMTCA